MKHLHNMVTNFVPLTGIIGILGIESIQILSTALTIEKMILEGLIGGLTIYLLLRKCKSKDK